MLKPIGFVLMLVAVGCASKQEPAAQAEGAEPEPSQGQEVAPGDVAAEPIPSTDEGSSAPSAGGESGEAAPAGAGRMAFTTCNADDRPQACTREYRPVCAEVDNGKRCVTTPCDSTDQKEFGNGCTACADAKTSGYWPVACDQLGSDAR